MVARTEALVDPAEKLLGGEVYHYHSKMELKSLGMFLDAKGFAVKTAND